MGDILRKMNVVRDYLAAEFRPIVIVLAIYLMMVALVFGILSLIYLR